LARRTLGDRGQAGFDADDVVQSAFVTFWKRASSGQFASDLDRNDLWKLLDVITVRKARQKSRDARAQKRGGGKVITESALSDGDDGPFDLDGQLGQLPTSDLDQTCEELLSKLEKQPRSIVLLKLMGNVGSTIYIDGGDDALSWF
jgi:DNA-directed RNA polymerase specialized sigma24 family protein